MIGIEGWFYIFLFIVAAIIFKENLITIILLFVLAGIIIFIIRWIADIFWWGKDNEKW